MSEAETAENGGGCRRCEPGIRETAAMFVWFVAMIYGGVLASVAGGAAYYLPTASVRWQLVYLSGTLGGAACSLGTWNFLRGLMRQGR